MLLKDATAEDIAAMSNRLYIKRRDKQAEKDIEEVVRMVQKRPFVIAPQKGKKTVSDSAFVNMLYMVLIASAGALAWNITGYYFFLFFFAAVSFMAAIEFKKAFT